MSKEKFPTAEAFMQDNGAVIGSHDTYDYVTPEMVAAYARLCAAKALEEAAENATLEDTEFDDVIGGLPIIISKDSILKTDISFIK